MVFDFVFISSLAPMYAIGATPIPMRTKLRVQILKRVQVINLNPPNIILIDDFAKSVFDSNFHYVLPGYSLFLISTFHKNMH